MVNIEAMKSLKGKVAISTGSGRHKGLGQGILKRLAMEGCRVVVSDIGTAKDQLEADNIGSTAEMDEIVCDIRDAGGKAVAIACDVRDESEVKALMDGAINAFGRLDIMINNAGVGYVMKAMDEMSLAEWNLVIGVNLTGAFLCSKYAARHMRRQGEGGRIINIASQAAKSGFPHMAPYTASKHGLIGLTRSNAIELGSENITVNAVCPNHVTTGLGEKQNAYFAEYRGVTIKEYLAAMRDRIPLGRPGLVEDVAATVAFLVSDNAKFITGEAMNVSGGEEMH